MIRAYIQMTGEAEYSSYSEYPSKVWLVYDDRINIESLPIQCNNYLQKEFLGWEKNTPKGWICKRACSSFNSGGWRGCETIFNQEQKPFLCTCGKKAYLSRIHQPIPPISYEDYLSKVLGFTKINFYSE